MRVYRVLNYVRKDVIMVDNIQQGLEVGMTKRQVIRAAKNNGASKEAIKKIREFFKADNDRKVSNPVEMALLNSFMTGEEMRIPTVTGDTRFNRNGTFNTTTRDRYTHRATGNIYGYESGNSYTYAIDSNGDNIVDRYKSGVTKDGVTTSFTDTNLDGTPDEISFDLHQKESHSKAEAVVKPKEDKNSTPVANTKWSTVDSIKSEQHLGRKEINNLNSKKSIKEALKKISDSDLNDPAAKNIDIRF